MAMFPQLTPVLFDRALHLGNDRMSEGVFPCFSHPWGDLFDRRPWG
jgi:hypothetical protein